MCALIRVGLGSLLALYHAVVLPRAEFFYGGQGALSFDASRDFVDPDHWTLFMWLPGDTGIATAVVALAMIQGILLAIGLASRFQAVCLYLLVYSLNYRNPLMLDGEDAVFRLALFLSLFMPLDARWSVGRRLLGKGALVNPVPLPAIGVLRLCMVGVFLSTVWVKLDGDTWLDGTALYYVMRLTEFSARFPYPHFLFEEAFWVRLLTWTVLSIEGLGALLIWSRRWRPYVLLAIYGLHLAIDYSMNLFLFQWVMIVGWTSFLDRSVLQVWGGHRRRFVEFVFKKGGSLDVREKR